MGAGTEFVKRNLAVGMRVETIRTAVIESFRGNEFVPIREKLPQGFSYNQTHPIRPIQLGLIPIRLIESDLTSEPGWSEKSKVATIQHRKISW